ncbi:MAG: chemotaxis protein CheA [Clostridiales bacterium]|nr:chemotaxis protein CheA [Clostridiales bacterium]
MSPIDSSIAHMIDTFVFETTTLLEQLDEILLEAEKSGGLDSESINEVFRIMHTIKGSSAMMGVENMATLSHRVEDLFFLIREEPSRLEPRSSQIFDLIFRASDFLKTEIELVGNEDYVPGDVDDIVELLTEEVNAINGLIEGLDEEEEDTSQVPEESRQEDRAEGESVHSIRVFFEDGSRMENIRAFMLLTQLKEYCDIIRSEPENPETDSSNSEFIIKNGFTIYLNTNNISTILSVIENSLYIKSYELLESEQPDTRPDEKTAITEGQSDHAPAKQEIKRSQVRVERTAKQSFISVNQTKLDKLMDLVGEIVITESMVTNSPDLKGLHLENFLKSTRELRKLNDELQDIVMSIRMVPLSGVFQRLNRTVRDMSKKLGKFVDFETLGGDTEVDKSINDIIGDPLMHMVRNAVDHAIEFPRERLELGKPERGTVTLSAKNVGGEIVIEVQDDGKGLDSEQILATAAERGILNKPESEYTEKEIFQLIMMPGFSTNDEVNEFSGRGVGMDVVVRSIEKLNGSVMVESKKGEGTKFTIKIPLTLAIVDGMGLSVGQTTFIVPITSITNTFRIDDETEFLYDTDGKEMIMHRNECYPIVRLYDFYNIPNAVDQLQDGIALLIRSGDKSIVIFADELLGEQQVVVKPFPLYLNKFQIKSYGLSGCAILGDGSISLILDAANLINRF